jgi:MarR family transcriptional regulator for hemolysin
VASDTELIERCTRAAKLLRGAADTALSRHGVRVGQNLVLEALAAQDGLTPGELAERLHVTTPTIVKMTSRMEATGLVERRRDSRDGRLVRLHLGAHGRAALRPIERERRELHARALAGLAPAERAALGAALAKLVANLEEDAQPADYDDAELPSGAEPKAAQIPRAASPRSRSSNA